MLVPVLLSLLQSTPAIRELVRVTGGPGQRDNATAIVIGNQTVVLWEEIRNGKTVIMRSTPDSARVLVSGWGHQWAPSVAVRNDTTWLACYYADISHTTGNREVVVIRYRGAFDTPLDTLAITHDTDRDAPVNDASPSMLLRKTRPPIVTWSSGRYHGDRPSAQAYDDKDIRISALDGKHRIFDLTSSRERGEEMQPVLAQWGTGYLLAYLGEKQNGHHALVLASYDARWRLRVRRVVARSAQGIARPALTVVDGIPYVAWVDNTTTDVTIARVDRKLRLLNPWSLRKALPATDFPKYGQPLAGLSGVSLYDAGSGLGIAFVATMEYRPNEGVVRQEVFRATLGR